MPLDAAPLPKKPKPLTRETYCCVTLDVIQRFFPVGIPLGVDILRATFPSMRIGLDFDTLHVKELIVKQLVGYGGVNFGVIMEIPGVLVDYEFDPIDYLIRRNISPRKLFERLRLPYPEEKPGSVSVIGRGVRASAQGILSATKSALGVEQPISDVDPTLGLKGLSIPDAPPRVLATTVLKALKDGGSSGNSPSPVVPTSGNWSMSENGGGLRIDAHPSSDTELEEVLRELPLGTAFVGETVYRTKVYGLLVSISRRGDELFLDYYHPLEHDVCEGQFKRDKDGSLKWGLTKEPISNFKAINKADVPVVDTLDIDNVFRTIFDLMVRSGVVKDPLANLEIELPDVEDEPPSPATSGKDNDLLRHFGRQAASL